MERRQRPADRGNCKHGIRLRDQRQHALGTAGPVCALGLVVVSRLLRLERRSSTRCGATRCGARRTKSIWACIARRCRATRSPARSPRSSCSCSAPCRSTRFRRSRSSSRRTAIKLRYDTLVAIRKTTAEELGEPNLGQLRDAADAGRQPRDQGRADPSDRRGEDPDRGEAVTHEICCSVRRRSWPQAASIASPLRWRKRTARPRSSRMRRNVCWALALGVR